MKEEPKQQRKDMVKKMIQGENGKRLLRVLRADGDQDRSGDESFAELYARTKVVLDRYFQQPGAFGFLPDMKKAEYYFRCQQSGNCCYQAPCVAFAYLSQKYGRSLDVEKGEAVDQARVFLAEDALWMQLLSLLSTPTFSSALLWPLQSVDDTSCIVYVDLDLFLHSKDEATTNTELHFQMKCEAKSIAARVRRDAFETCSSGA